MEIMTDHVRMADDDNPRGYYEYEPVKRIKEDVSWLNACKGKAVKIISMLLFHLPPDREYRVVFMKREMEEILASQKAMLQRQGQKEEDVDDEKLAQTYLKHMRQIEKWIAEQGNMAVIYVNYSDVIKDSARHASAVNQFLSGWLDPEKMVGIVEAFLYRQRKTKIPTNEKSRAK